MALKEENQKKIDEIIIKINHGDLIEFGEISNYIFGNKAAGGVIGRYVNSQRGRENYPWWRVVNYGGHPVVDDNAIIRLKSEGHTIINGIIENYKVNK